MAKKHAHDVDPQAEEDINANPETNEDRAEAMPQDEPVQMEDEKTVPTTAPRTYHRFWHWVVAHKRISVPVLVVAVLVILSAIPFTRYVLAGTILRQSFTVKVLDRET